MFGYAWVTVLHLWLGLRFSHVLLAANASAIAWLCVLDGMSPSLLRCTTSHRLSSLTDPHKSETPSTKRNPHPVMQVGLLWAAAKAAAAEHRQPPRVGGHAAMRRCSQPRPRSGSAAVPRSSFTNSRICWRSSRCWQRVRSGGARQAAWQLGRAARPSRQERQPAGGHGGAVPLQQRIRRRLG